VHAAYPFTNTSNCPNWAKAVLFESLNLLNVPDILKHLNCSSSDLQHIPNSIVHDLTIPCLLEGEHESLLRYQKSKNLTLTDVQINVMDLNSQHQQFKASQFQIQISPTSSILDLKRVIIAHLKRPFFFSLNYDNNTNIKQLLTDNSNKLTIFINLDEFTLTIHNISENENSVVVSNIWPDDSLFVLGRKIKK
jgi:hypothetical protein